nr:23S rRNA (adenine(2030)-N(6))-methyltransferase RlmJ [Oleomonas cavernae]
MRHEAGAWPAVARSYRELVAPGMAAAAPFYPGSPLLALGLLREQDRLIACDLVDEVAADLKAALRGDLRAAVHARDGWAAIRAFLPQKTGRTVVLIDPPFEAKAEFDLLAHHLIEAARRAPAAIVLGWYPLKGRAAADRLHATLAQSGVARILAAELLTQPADDAGRFAGSGIIVIRPPWQLDAALAQGLPRLLDLTGFGATGTTAVTWLAGEENDNR